MSSTVSHELSRAMLSELLSSEKDATRVWLRAEVDRLVDPMLDSIFDRLTTKLTNGLERTQSTGAGECAQLISSTAHDQLANVHLSQPPTATSFKPTEFHFNHQHAFMNYQSQPQSNVYESISVNPNSIRQSSPSSPVPPPTGLNAQISLSNQLTNIETSTIPIKHEIEPNEPTHCNDIANEQSNHNSIDQNWDEDEDEEEECDCDDCVNGGFEVKEEDEEDDARLIDHDRDEEELPRSLKRPKMDMNQQTNTQPELTRQSQRQSTDEVDQLESEQIQALQCPLCSRTFDRRCRLDQHVQMHTRPFECDLCDKRFTQKCNLDSHLRTHSGARPYKCRFCEQCFTEMSTRKKHEQAKHLHVKPYRCKVCGHTSTLRSSIITHIRMVHFGLPQTLKEQRERNIIDDRDPRDLFEKVEHIV